MTIVSWNRLGAALMLVFNATVASGSEITGGPAEDRAAMQAVSAKWLQSYNDADLGALMSLMHDDALR